MKKNERLRIILPLVWRVCRNKDSNSKYWSTSNSITVTSLLSKNANMTPLEHIIYMLPQSLFLQKYSMGNNQGPNPYSNWSISNSSSISQLSNLFIKCEWFPLLCESIHFLCPINFFPQWVQISSNNFIIHWRMRLLGLLSLYPRRTLD